VVNADNSPCDDRPRSNCWDQLTQSLPFEQKEQLAQLILARLAAGWGEIEIEFDEHHIKVFREVNSIRAKRPVSKSE
jgi:hypothetical protein